MKSFKMGGMFKFRGQILHLNFRRWRERQGRRAALRYFLQKPKEDSRSMLGRTMDIVGGLLMVWLTGFVLLANLTGRPAVSLILSVPVLGAAAIALKKVSVLREKRRKYQISLWLAGQRFMEDILRMNPQKDFRSYVRDILERLPGFQQVNLKTDTGEREQDQGYDLEAVYKGRLLAVHCRPLEAGSKSLPGEIRAFAGALQLGGYKNGLFITTGEFGPGILPVIREFARNGINIKPVDRYRLMDLARQAGLAAFPGSESEPGTPLEAAGKKLKAAVETIVTALLESTFSSRKKAKSYFLYGILLYGGHILLKDYAGLSLVYLFFAALNLLLAAGSIYLGKSLEEIDPLD